MTKAQTNFSFGDYASEFDYHIETSIPGYAEILTKLVQLSRRVIQPRSYVYDIGCSTGRLITTVRNENRSSRTGATYVGIDNEPAFAARWPKETPPDLKFELGDIRGYPYQAASLIISTFTVQFIPPMDKRALLKCLHDCLVEGGALLIAEKTLAETARLQDALTFPYYDRKISNGFSAEHILDKERSLRGCMTLLSEAELRKLFRQTGFREIERVGGEAPFAAFLAFK